MTVWSHLSTISTRQYALRIAMILAICVAIITTLLFGFLAHATTGINKTIGFQGRLLDASGNVVPDGNYNIQFKIYQDGTGTAAGNPSGTLKWTETYINNGGTDGVEVKNGYLSVNLGSLNAFGSQIDWNQDTLWLSMNIAGKDSACTTFGTSPCVADGEMLPMKRLTSSPYSLNSGLLDGKTSSQYVQLGQGVQTDAVVNSSSIFVNKTSTGNLVRLQNNASDVLTIDDSGDITFGSTGDRTISVADAAASTAGNSITVSGGAGGSGTGSNGGGVILVGGDGGGTNANGGNISISGGSGVGTGSDGLVVISTPTFSTVINDANCYTSGSPVASSCTIANSSVNSSSGILVGFSTSDKTATLPDPTNITAGRISLIMASPSSEAFTLLVNGGGAGNKIILQPNQSATMVWNGSDWTSSGASNQRPLVYSDDNTNIQVGDGVSGGTTTTLTLDQASSAPSIGVPSDMYGSMYYDTTIGKVQCYEADGWGNCSASPDNYVTISPEYTNAVTNGTGTGTLTSDFCSDALNINDGTTPQPTICGTNETYNFYQWTSSETTAQEKNIYVTYQLPANFTGFVSGSTSLMGQIDSSTDAAVSYQVYKNTASGLTACGSAQSVSSTGSWQKVTASGSADPASCSFSAGNNLVLKITLSAKNDAKAFVSTLGFAFSDN